MKLATLCYVQRNGKTLMVHRVKKSDDMHLGKWNGLGGKFEPGETPEECARREIYEESGLEVRDLELKGFLTFPGFANEEDWYAFVFVAQADRDDVVEPPEGYLEWVEDERLTELALWEGDRIFLPWLARPEFFSAKFEYTAGRLKAHSVVFYPDESTG
ncbi:MAG TPA: 8-oxo-dGTP diphosphatase [Anaerolineales bacterium]|nr:8-oxo-dGTP diphosphatase [Anaerolineales bacterium]